MRRLLDHGGRSPVVWSVVEAVGRIDHQQKTNDQQRQIARSSLLRGHGRSLTGFIKTPVFRSVHVLLALAWPEEIPNVSIAVAISGC